MPVRSGVARFKLVIAATREGVHLHPSIEDIPTPQQKLAREALDGDLAATLLIADKAGLKRMKTMMAQVEDAKGLKTAPASVALLVGLGLLGCSLVALALLGLAWYR